MYGQNLYHSELYPITYLWESSRVGGSFYPESPSKGYLVSEKIILFGFSISGALHIWDSAYPGPADAV